ncbi:MAG: hypothetical protein ABJG41_16890 [Cyclobacteriaceae bacterium]
MKDSTPSNVTKLTVIDTVERILIAELKSMVYDHQGSAFIKFINIAVGIEYFGACLDVHAFQDFNKSEERFNNALKKLFPKKYEKYAKSGAEIYFFRDFRGTFIHQIRPGKNVVVTHRNESKREGTTHLKKTKSGDLVLVLEDFFDDFEKAGKALIKKAKDGKLPTKKDQQNYIRLVSIQNNG